MIVTSLRFVFFIAALFAWPSFADAKVLHVTASFTILADMVRTIGGAHVEVASLVGPNGDPHAYEPTPDDAKKLRSADLVVVNGLGLEGWMERLITASGYKGSPLVLTKNIAPLKMEEGKKLVLDPHAWNSAANAAIYAQNIIDALCTIDPGDAEDFKQQGAAYIETLRALDADTHRRIDAIPAETRKIVTTHDAFQYFAHAYGVSFITPVGVSTEQEASAADIVRLIKQIRAAHVQIYFLENSNDPRLIEQIARATGAEPGGELYVEALSRPDGPAPTYLELFRHNVDLMVAAMKK